MMIANSACLVITIRPFNQHHNVRRRDVTSDVDNNNLLGVDLDDDEICEHLQPARKSHPATITAATGRKSLPPPTSPSVTDDHTHWVIHA